MVTISKKITNAPFHYCPRSNSILHKSDDSILVILPHFLHLKKRLPKLYIFEVVFQFALLHCMITCDIFAIPLKYSEICF